MSQKVPPMEISSDFLYESHFIEVLGSRMHYVDKGDGDPILFLHGQPTSSYLWRNVMPHVESQGRVIAPDNIGFGKSDQPDLDYVFSDHYRYIEGFIEALNLNNITLVVHDWGSGLGLHYAQQHPDNIKAIVLMESIVGPMMPAESYEALPKQLADFFRMVRDPVLGPKLLIDDNYFVEVALPGPTRNPAIDPFRAAASSTRRSHDHQRQGPAARRKACDRAFGGESCAGVVLKLRRESP